MADNENMQIDASEANEDGLLDEISSDENSDGGIQDWFSYKVNMKMDF